MIGAEGFFDTVGDFVRSADWWWMTLHIFLPTIGVGIVVGLLLITFGWLVRLFLGILWSMGHRARYRSKHLHRRFRHRSIAG